MKTTFYVHHPNYFLKSFIELIWYAEGEPDLTRERVLPNGVIEWIFNVGTSPHKVIDRNNPNRFELFQESWVAGFQDTFLTIQSMGETKLFGIRFKPGGAYSFMKVPLDEITNQVIDLQFVIDTRLDEITERLHSAQSMIHGIKILEKFLVQILVEPKSDQVVSYVIQHLSRKSIKTIVDETAISHKQLIHRFHQQVGTSPKKLQQIMGFQTAIQRMAVLPRLNLAFLAQELGYFDQSHFNHIFKQFSGVSPTFYLEQRTFDPNHLILER